MMAEQLFKLPLKNTPQRFAIELAGKQLIMETKWNEEQPAWELNVYDGVTQEPLITSMPLVTGANLLEQFAHKGIPGQLIAYTEGDEFAPPTLDNLGVEAELYYLVDVQ